MKTISIRPADPESPAAQACLSAYLGLLVRRIPGLPLAHLPFPDPEVASYHPPKGRFLLAFADESALACVALKTLSPGVGEVKRLWVAPEARGHGLARRMMAAVEDAARNMGITLLKLDTNEHLPEAIALYHALGWTETAPYTAFPATHWFERAI